MTAVVASRWSLLLMMESISLWLEGNIVHRVSAVLTAKLGPPQVRFLPCGALFSFLEPYVSLCFPLPPPTSVHSLHLAKHLQQALGPDYAGAPR